MTPSTATLRAEPTTSVPPPPVLDVRDIALGYRRRGRVTNPVLRDFSMQLAAGEVVAVLGPSGVGKSSLLRVLGGLQVADAGEVSALGEPVRKPHPRVATVFQDPCLLPWLTLEENVGFGLTFKHQPALDGVTRQQRIDDAIAEVGLDHARGRYPAQLSGGMAQRTALARSLARQPEILLLDEPFSALDEITRGEMQVLLQQITRRHRSAAVLVTHDIDEALILADRILLLGGEPAGLIGEWQIDQAYPRDLVQPAMTRTRVEILQALRGARHVGERSTTHPRVSLQPVPRDTPRA